MSAVQAASAGSRGRSAPVRLPLLKPHRLAEGDRVALLAPSSRPHNPASINRAVKLVEQLGFRPVVGKNVLNIHGFMAGTDAERLADLTEAWRDDSIKAIFCLTGGYGVMHLLDKFDFDLAKQKPKLYVGSDDNNNFALALYSRAGLASLHSPNLDRIVSKEAFQSLKEALTSGEPLPFLTASYPDSGVDGAVSVDSAGSEGSGAGSGGSGGSSVESEVFAGDARDEDRHAEPLSGEAAGSAGASHGGSARSKRGSKSSSSPSNKGSEKGNRPKSDSFFSSGGRLQVEYRFVPVPGRVEGPLVGGNLTVLTGLMGTPFQPALEESILYLEDVNEHNDMLDRWFTTLYVSGELAKTAGVAFGDFDNCGAKDSYNLLSLEDLFGDRLKEMKKPSCFGFPFGQSARSRTIPLGVRARLNAEVGTIEFLEPALS